MESSPGDSVAFTRGLYSPMSHRQSESDFDPALFVTEQGLQKPSPGELTKPLGQLSQLSRLDAPVVEENLPAGQGTSAVPFEK